MAETLSIEWRNDGIRGVVARVDSARAVVTGAFDVPWPADAMSDADAAAFLRRQVAEAGFTGREAVVQVQRSSSVVRRLDLPPVPDAELPDVVAMQAATRSSSGLEGLALDFVPLPGSDGEGRRVLAATVSRDLLDRITRVCEAAGLRVGTVGLGSLGVAELVVRSTQRDPSETVLLVGVHDGTLETVLVSGVDVLFTQSSELNSESPDQLGKAVAADVRRMLLAHGGGLSTTSLDHVWWIGEAERTATERAVVSNALKVEVEPFDPLSNAIVETRQVAGDVDGSAFAAAVGGLLLESGARVPRVNFLEPRKPPKRIDHEKRRRIVIAAVAAAAVLLLVVWSRLTVSGLDERIATLKAAESALDRTIREGEPVRAKAARVRTWEALDRDWLSELTAFTSHLPGRERVLLDEFNGSVDPRSPAGRLEGSGRGKTRDELTEAQAKLDEAGYVVPPFVISSRSTGDGYDRRFTFDVRLPAATPGQEANR